MTNTQNIQSRKEKRKKKKGFAYWSMTISSIVLAIVDIFLICSPLISDYILNGWLNAQTKAVSNLSASDFEANQNADATFDYADVQSLSLEQLLKTNFDVSYVKAIGEIAVPSVGINLTIAKGVSDYNMTVAAGTLRADQKMGEGNYPLASHYSFLSNKQLLFTPIDRMKNGDLIYITDAKNVYIYETYATMIVEPTRVDLAENMGGDPIITLITCANGDNRKRYIVQGKLKTIVPVDQASSDIIDVFKMTKSIRQNKKE